jgi:hypothetical protein
MPAMNFSFRCNKVRAVGPAKSKLIKRTNLTFAVRVTLIEAFKRDSRGGQHEKWQVESHGGECQKRLRSIMFTISSIQLLAL